MSYIEDDDTRIIAGHITIFELFNDLSKLVALKIILENECAIGINDKKQLINYYYVNKNNIQYKFNAMNGINGESQFIINLEDNTHIIVKLITRNIAPAAYYYYYYLVTHLNNTQHKHSEYDSPNSIEAFTYNKRKTFEFGLTSYLDLILETTSTHANNYVSIIRPAIRPAK